MRIIHLADTHLGYSAYRKITEEGVNQREMDTYDAFIRCIDYIILSKPDVVLHAGDLFDSVRPTNRAITLALQQIIRLSKENIPFIIISGNHETPKLKETGNIFSIFEHLPHVYPIYKNRYEKLSVETKGKTLMIHAIPHCQSPSEFDKNLKKITIDTNAAFNVLIAHGAVADIKEFKMNECNELFIPVKNLKDDFDYIALGHYHKHLKVQENAFYAGSTEHFSFSEAEDQKGLLEIDLRSTIKHRFIPIQTRTMIDSPPVDCTHLTLEQVIKKIKDNIISLEPQEKIIRIRLQNIPVHIQRGIDFHQIQELGKTAVHFEVKATTTKQGETPLGEGYQMKSLAHEYEKFLTAQNPPEKELLLTLGLAYINKIEQQEDSP